MSDADLGREAAVKWPMKTCDAFLFLLIGLGMIAGLTIWPEHFGPSRPSSASWVLFMGGLQALGGSCVLAIEAVDWTRRMATLAPLDFTVTLADVRRLAPPSIYTLLDNPEEEEVALRLRQQLLRPVRG
jgi:hypothetical protein